MTELRFAFPMDGVMLTRAVGREEGGKLQITGIANALPGRNLTMNGVPMVFHSNIYSTVKPFGLASGRNTVELCDTDTGEKQVIDVWYLPNAYMKYRFSLDDNIWFLQNLAKNQNVYKSMFEDPWLTLLKTMHDRYGTKFHVNIYYECPEFGGFNLTMLSDKFKDEWKYNSDWLRLSCHANANLPDHPYIQATYNQTYFEFKRVQDQILRFAGEEAFAGPVTTIHWGDATEDAVRAVRDLGIRCMVGSFMWGLPNDTTIAYHMNAEQCALLNIYGLYFDKKTDMMFFRYGGAAGGHSLQHGPLSEVAPGFSIFRAGHPYYPLRELCLHEEYFYPHYKAYMPDYYDRFETGIRWCVDNGYEPSFAREAFDL